MIQEVELPGDFISTDGIRIIYARYYWASKFVSDKKILEVGCGPGIALGYLAQKVKKVVAFDLSSNNLKIAKNYCKENKEFEKIKLLQGDAKDLSFLGKEKFDVILAMASSYYFNLDIFIPQCRKVLKDKGTLLLDMPNKNLPGFRPSEQSLRYYSVPELSAIMNKYDFDVEICGAFPVNRYFLAKNKTKRMLSDLRDVLPGSNSIKHLCDKFIFRKLCLKSKIEEEDIEYLRIKDIRFTSLPLNMINETFRILYVAASARHR